MAFKRSGVQFSSAPPEHMKAVFQTAFFVPASPVSIHSRPIRRLIPQPAFSLPSGGEEKSPLRGLSLTTAEEPPCPRKAETARFFFPEQFQFETLRVSNHTACRFTEKAQFFRSLWAGRRCAAASRFTFFKAKTLYFGRESRSTSSMRSSGRRLQASMKR